MRIGTEQIIVDRLGHEVAGTLRVPGSKSMTNRAIILAICSDAASVIEDPLFSDDTYYGLQAARRLGCDVETSASRITIRGIGRRRPTSGASIDVGSAGTIARFLPCVLAFGEPGEWVLTASEQMSQRPMGGLVRALAQLGDCVECLTDDERYPLRVRGDAVRRFEVDVDGSVSSQYLSGILLAAGLLTHPLSLRTDGEVVQSEYVAMTVDCMRLFGAEVVAQHGWREITVSPASYAGASIDVEADASTASYFAALPAVRGGAIDLPNLTRNSRQPDTRFLDILKRFGCELRWAGERGVRVTRPSELTALRGGHRLDLNDCSDVALTTAAVSVFADSPVEIVGVEHIRHHECDRIAAMAEALSAMGVRVHERHDGWKIWPSPPAFAEVGTRDDHRVAMASAVVGLGGSGVALDHPACVNKTCPSFFELIGKLGAQVRRP